MSDIFEQLKENWNNPLVARRDVGKFSGGLLNSRTLANRDSLGTGPAGRIVVNGRVAYSVDELIAWMIKK